MKIKRPIFLILFTLININYLIAQQQTSFFNTAWLKATVSIETKVKNKYVPIGTGFLLATFSNHIMLVTAKHVILDERDSISVNLYYRLNAIDTSSSVFEANYPPKLHVNKGWFLSDKYDVAARFISYSEKSDLTFIDSAQFLVSNNLSPAANVLILGFPLGLRSEKYSTPIVRKGIVAKSENGEIIIDAFVFPGNSGGPVLYTPPLRLGEGLHSNLINEERLIGLVSNYIPYQDIAISQQTKRPRISFEENAGLCNIVPVEAIIELMKRTDFKNIDDNMYMYR
jgi:hypothetical protein